MTKIVINSQSAIGSVHEYYILISLWKMFEYQSVIRLNGLKLKVQGLIKYASREWRRIYYSRKKVSAFMWKKEFINFLVINISIVFFRWKLMYTDIWLTIVFFRIDRINLSCLLSVSRSLTWTQSLWTTCTYGNRINEYFYINMRMIA